MDLWGKYPVQSINGNSYYLVMVDDASRFTTVEFLKSKAHAADKIKNYIAYLSARGRSPCALRMDRGTEFVNQPLKSWCDSRGIRLQLTAPYSPSQNGVAERMNRTLVELVRAMLAAFKLPQFLWEPAVLHAAYLQNMLYTKVHPRATPYQIWYGIKLNVEHLREFGAPVWILLQGQNVQKKMLPKSQRRIYVRYDEGSHSVKYYNPETRNIQLSRNYKYLNLHDPCPTHDVVIEPPPPAPNGPSHEGELGIGMQHTIVDKGKRKADEDIDPRVPQRLRETHTEPEPQEPRKMQGIRVDY